MPAESHQELLFKIQSKSSTSMMTTEQKSLKKETQGQAI